MTVHELIEKLLKRPNQMEEIDGCWIYFQQEAWVLPFKRTSVKETMRQEGKIIDEL